MFTLLCQNVAWAVCADGSTFPVSGYVNGQPPASSWSPGLFTATGGSIFVPDNSVFEHNDPNQPVTGGGHNWVFDQGTTLCKAIDVGPAGGTPMGWTIPLSGTPDCVFLPIIRFASGNPPVPVVISFGDVPLQGNAVTPTCDPTQYVGDNPLVGPALPANTYFNHLGCSISHGAANTPQTATTYLFVAAARGGLFVVPLTNVANPTVGGDAGKAQGGPADWFGQIPLGQKLTNAAVSPDGQFVLATSIRRLPTVFGCYNPLGDPTRTNPVTGVQSFPITGPVDPNFSVSPANTVPCTAVGNNGLQVDLTTAFGPDGQPYFGGAKTVNSFNADPGGPAATAWPQCIFNGFAFANPPPTTLMGKLAVVFNAHFANRCGTAVPNVGFPAVVQPEAIISHGSYMYAGPLGGPTLQTKVTTDPVSGLSQYASRTYVSGLALITGLGVADDLKSVMNFTDPSDVGAAGQAVIVKVPLCEDM
jgi:hypothetical protein